MSDDLDLEGDRPNATGPGIKFVHRPDQGTPLKNKHKSERWNSISDGIAQVLGDHVNDQRIESFDEHGREPLISTEHGRMSRSAIRSTMYRVTRPCWYGDGCPHDREIETCKATKQPSMSHTDYCSLLPASADPALALAGNLLQ